MELEKMCEDHIIALENFVQLSIHSIDNSNRTTQTPLAEYFDQVQSLKEDDERNLEGLKENIKGLQNTHEATKQHLSSLEKKIDVLKKEKENLQEQKTLKKKLLIKVKKQHEIQENTVLQIQKQLLKDSESHSILDRNKNELLLYKQMTGISWDFRASPQSVRGYVTNTETSFLKCFDFNKEKMSIWQVAEALWEIISLSSLKHSKQL